MLRWGMLPSGPQDPNVSGVGPSEVPPEVDPQAELQQAFAQDPREPVLQALADAIQSIAKRVTVESQAGDVKDYGAGAESFAKAMAALNPPMKPIDPNLHASQRGVDPQAVFDAQVAAGAQAADQAHAVGMKAVDLAAQQQAQQRAARQAGQQPAPGQKPQPQQKPQQPGKP